MRAARFVAGALYMFVAAAGTDCVAHAQAAGASRAQRHAANQAVYLIKGLAGFQTGVVDLGEKLRKRGIVPRIESHLSSDSVADEIIARYRTGLRAPIILVGYSLGADAAASIATRLYEHRVPVALLITFAPVANARVSPNVARAVNYYLSNSMWRGKLVPATAFHGSLHNVKLDDQPDINHFTIISSNRYQLETIARISAVLGHARRPAQPHTAASPAGAAQQRPTANAGSPRAN